MISIVSMNTAEIEEKINALRAWPINWNGYEVDKPDHASIDRALLWIREMQSDATTDIQETTCAIGADENGQVVFEWFNDSKTLTIYIDKDGPTYLKAWGPNMFSDMEDGDATTSEKRRELWQWLIGFD